MSIIRVTLLIVSLILPCVLSSHHGVIKGQGAQNFISGVGFKGHSKSSGRGQAGFDAWGNTGRWEGEGERELSGGAGAGAHLGTGWAAGGGAVYKGRGRQRGELDIFGQEGRFAGEGEREIGGGGGAMGSVFNRPSVGIGGKGYSKGWGRGGMEGDVMGARGDWAHEGEYDREVSGGGVIAPFAGAPDLENYALLSMGYKGRRYADIDYDGEYGTFWGTRGKFGGQHRRDRRGEGGFEFIY